MHCGIWYAFPRTTTKPLLFFIYAIYVRYYLLVTSCDYASSVFISERNLRQKLAQLPQTHIFPAMSGTCSKNGKFHFHTCGLFLCIIFLYRTEYEWENWCLHLYAPPSLCRSITPVGGLACMIVTHARGIGLVQCTFWVWWLHIVFVHSVS